MGDARARRSAHRHRITGERRLGHGGEDTVLFVADVDEFDLPVAMEGLDDRIERIADDAIAALDTGSLQHLPQNVRHCLCHVCLRSELYTPVLRGWTPIRLYARSRMAGQRHGR